MARVWEWSQAEGTSLLIMLALADHADDDGFCYPGVPRIAKKCRISPRSVQRHVQELESIGELEVQIGKGIITQGGATNRYRLTVGKPPIQPGDKLAGGDNEGGEVVTNRAGSGDIAMSHQPKEEPSISQPSLYPLSPQGGVDGSSIKTKCDLAEGFEDFWKAYPKKEKKDKALTAWKRKRCHAIREEVMLALALHKTTPKWTKGKPPGQFIPYPATWINGGEWKNETSDFVTAPKATSQEKEKKGF